MSLRNVRLVTFDATNTLIKFRKPTWQFYKMTALGHGFTGSDDELKDKLKKSMKVMTQKYPNYGQASIAWEKWWTEVVKMTLKDHLPLTADIKGIATHLIEDFKTKKCLSVADGVPELINHLRKLNISIGVISNFDPRLYDILQNFNLDKSFDFVLTSYEMGCSKPDKKIFQNALEICKRKIAPSQALHIGDDIEKDYNGARKAGWQAILINPDINPEKYPEEHVFRTIEHCYDTIKWKDVDA